MLSDLLKNKGVKTIILGAALVAAGCSGSNSKPHPVYIAKEKPVMVLSQGTGIVYFCWNMNNNKQGNIDLVTKNPVDVSHNYPNMEQLVVAYDSSAIGNNALTWRNKDFIKNQDSKIMNNDEANKFFMAARYQQMASNFLESINNK